MHRTDPCGTQPPPLRTCTLVIRPVRLTAAGLVLLAIAAVLSLVLVAAAQASVWVIPTSSRVFPTTLPGPRQAIALNAAGNEYEGVQVALRGGGDHAVSFSWGEGSDPLIVDNTLLHRVYYVKVTLPTFFLGSKPGWYPDPLVPRDFGKRVGIPGSTTPFYLLTHVPYGTPPGTYTATLHVVNGTETVDLPVSLRVWNFGWTSLSTQTGMAVSIGGIARSLDSSGISFSGETRRRILAAFFKMMHEHGISPTTLCLYADVSANGHFNARAYGADIAQYLDSSGVGLPDTQIPWLNWFPWSRDRTSPSATKLQTYLTEMYRLFKARGWQKKAYTYIIDETVTTTTERYAERLARASHRASAKAGFRCRFLLTDDPRPHAIGTGIKKANTFLYDDVDIWALRYYYFFGRVPAIRERQRHGKEIWWYTYGNGSISKMPSFVIDKPHIDSRVWGWLMEQWQVDGLLNWGFNRWGKPTTGRGWRDPYQNPLSVLKGTGKRSNGQVSLVYPGYYPRYGLNDPYAPPVSSLRFEALRDGLEEREYLKLAKLTGSGGPAFVTRIIKRVTQFPYPIRQGNIFTFPKYSKSSSVYDAARAALAVRIEAYQE